MLEKPFREFHVLCFMCHVSYGMCHVLCVAAAWYLVGTVVGTPRKEVWHPCHTGSLCMKRAAEGVVLAYVNGMGEGMEGRRERRSQHLRTLCS